MSIFLNSNVTQIYKNIAFTFGIKLWYIEDLICLAIGIVNVFAH